MQEKLISQRQRLCSCQQDNLRLCGSHPSVGVNYVTILHSTTNRMKFITLFELSGIYILNHTTILIIKQTSKIHVVSREICLNNFDVNKLLYVLRKTFWIVYIL